MCGKSLETLLKAKVLHSEPEPAHSHIAELVAVALAVLVCGFIVGFIAGRSSVSRAPARSEVPEVERPPRSHLKGKGLGKLITLPKLG